MIARLPVIAMIRYDTGKKDTRNGIIYAYKDEPRMAYGFAPSASNQAAVTSAAIWVTKYRLFAPWTLANWDKVRFGGKTYAMDGEPEDWSLGPWASSAGYVLNLKLST
ncbi:hypothetical protein [Luteococcus sp.]|uniref:hypothetical protein n=1 Tax=Luteococcus sp. TaxID=1969402 RepID=UPI003737025B